MWVVSEVMSLLLLGVGLCRVVIWLSVRLSEKVGVMRLCLV